MSRQIPLTQGKVAIVDDTDFEWLNQYKWYCDSKGYVVRGIRKNGKIKREYMSRLIMGNPIGKMIDHKDRNPLNNRKNNLRPATRGNNRSNSKPSIKTSSYKGVCKVKSTQNKSNPWLSTIKANSKSIYLGYFDSEIKAAKVYDEAAKRLFGEFAKLNFPFEKVA